MRAASPSAPSCGQHRNDVVSDALLVADLGTGLVALPGVILYELLAPRPWGRSGLFSAALESPPRRTCATAPVRTGLLDSQLPEQAQDVPRSTAFARYWSMKTLRPVGATLYWTPGTSASQGSTACTWDCAGSTADLLSLIFTMMDPRKARFPEAFLGHRKESKASPRKAPTYIGPAYFTDLPAASGQGTVQRNAIRDLDKI